MPQKAKRINRIADPGVAFFVHIREQHFQGVENTISFDHFMLN